MITTGSRLGATPRSVTSFSISHTASMNSPSRTAATQVISAAKAMVPPPADTSTPAVGLTSPRPGLSGLAPDCLPAGPGRANLGQEQLITGDSGAKRSVHYLLMPLSLL